MRSAPQRTEFMANPFPSPASQVSRALAKRAYIDRHVRLIDADMTGYSHIVSTRGGLLAIAPDRWKRLCYGMFFGLVSRPDALFVFESCDLPRERTAMGRVLRFDKTDVGLSKGRILIQGLDNGCHQMDVIDNELVLTDTYNQRLLVVPTQGGSVREIHPLPEARLNDWGGGYHHVNSILPVADQILLMLHNGADAGRRSAIAAFDRQWSAVWTHQLPGPGCHDLTIDEGGALVSCNSMAGAVMTSDGRTTSVSSMMTRGLSVDPSGIVVGSTQYASRKDRSQASGMVSFLSPDLDRQADLSLPSGPTAIRRWDGADILAQRCRALDPRDIHFCVTQSRSSIA